MCSVCMRGGAGWGAKDAKEASSSPVEVGLARFAFSPSSVETAEEDEREARTPPSPGLGVV